MTNERTDEAERIVREYDRRRRELPADFYSLHHPANLFLRHSQEEAVLWGLRRARLAPLTQHRVLDIGCGTGDWLGLFERFGASSDRIAGIELGDDRVVDARRRFRESDIRQGDAETLPWKSGTFDVVFQCTVFTSILDSKVRSAVAQEMLRVLSRDGAIIWLDFCYDNPRNKNVSGIGRSELRRLFPNCSIDRRRIALAPPLARRIVPWSWRLARLLEMTTIFNTHYLAVIRRSS